MTTWLHFISRQRCQISYPEPDGRADKNPYPHDRRADKDSYPHNSNSQSESESELLLVTRSNDNHSPGPVMREVSP